MSDRGTKRPGVILQRAYAIAGAVILCGLLPGFLIKLGTERVHPLDLRQLSARDGSAAVSGSPGGVRVTEVTVGEERPAPPGSFQIARDLRTLPVNTPLAYRVLQNGGPSTLRGVVLERSSPPDRVIASALRAALGLVLALAGAALAVAGAERRAVAGGAALSSIGVLFGAAMLEPTLVQLEDFGLRNAAAVVWQSYPRDLAMYFLAAFLSLFPGKRTAGRAGRALRVFLFAAAVGLAAVTTYAQIPGLESRLSIGAQVRVIEGVGVVKPGLLVLGAAYAAILIAAQRRQYLRLALPADDARRARMLGWALVVAIVPAILAVVVQGGARLLTGRSVLGVLPISVTFASLLLVPVALAYVLLTRDPLTPRLLVHRTRLFAFSEKTARLAALVPLLVLAVFLYVHRAVPLRELIADHLWFLALAGTAASLALLYGDRVRRGLERVFFRDRDDARKLVDELAEKSRAAKDPASVETLLTGTIVRALHAESAALFVRDPLSRAFVCPTRSLPALDGTAAILGGLGGQSVIDLDPTDRRSAPATLPEIERHWVEESHARLLLPLRSADGAVIGLLTVGENLSELPWDREDKRLLAAAASSAALALENTLLRSSGGVRSSPPAVSREDGGLARFCPACDRIFAAALGPFCSDDQTALAVADVPHVLAGKYRFERRIGSGGMGVVHLARDLSLGRFVAIKTLPRVSAQASLRLRREARATARVLHPNLAVIFAVETWRGIPMLILEYLEGGTLAPRIARGPVPVGQILSWGVALSGALEAAHARGVLHRDIKPSNIGFTESGEPKLLDFGLASLYDEPELAAAAETSSTNIGQLETLDLKQATASGRIVGTVPYLAPEAVLGEPPQVSFDVWSLSLTLYEAVTGSNPFLELPAEKTLNRILNTVPPPATVRRPDCPEALADLLASSLSRDRSRRPRTARALRVLLQKIPSA